MKASRSIVVHPVGGAACLPLTMTMECGEDECPIDCIIGDWTEWSSCSAQCGGGVVERARGIVREAAHGGEACGDTSETNPCNIQSCDADCSLSEWSDWGPCTAECGGGSEDRMRTVKEDARGTGTCPEPFDHERLTFRTCNGEPCEDKLTDGRSVLECESMIDLMLLVDGSGSLGPDGWEQVLNMTGTIVNSLQGGDNGVQVAVLLFSGPDTYAKLYKCFDGGDVDMEKDCQIKWVSRFSTDFAAVATEVANMQWPGSSTLTSMALAEASQMIQNGRQNAQTVTVVITDGKPLSKRKTKKAAKELQEKSKVVWVPVGDGVPIDLIESMASLPVEDHVIKIDTFGQMSDPKEINKIMKSACPHVG